MTLTQLGFNAARSLSTGTPANTSSNAYRQVPMTSHEEFTDAPSEMAGAGFSVSAVVFDLGGVLMDWNPDYLYRQLIPGGTNRGQSSPPLLI